MCLVWERQEGWLRERRGQGEEHGIMEVPCPPQTEAERESTTGNATQWGAEGLLGTWTRR